tara:strand:+ start:654 stop:2483 length:1830 start_codon:yes stop_codon:yes gene_type:complete
MKIKKILTSVILLFSVFFSYCGGSSSLKENKILSESENLNHYLDRVYDEYIDRHPEYQTYLGIKKDYGKWDDISPEAANIELEHAKIQLKWLEDSVNIKYLDSQALLSYHLFEKKLNNQIEDHKYRLYNYPINQMSGMQSRIPAFLINMHKIISKKDALDYVERINGIRPLFDQLILNLKERQFAGIIAPNFIYDHVLNDSRNVISGHPFSGKDTCAIFKDFHNKVVKLNLSSTEKMIMLEDCKEALLKSVKPAYKKLIQFVKKLKNEYDEEDGVWRWENGDAFFDNALHRTTTIKMGADEIHQLGLREVKRIHEEMNSIKSAVGFPGTLQEFFKELKENDSFYYPETEKGKQDYISEAENIIEKFKLKLDDLFITKPKADMVVKAVESFREKSAGKAFYQRPAPDGSRPGTYYANTYRMRMMPKYQMEALAYHEGIPGHHMQISIAQELTGLPKFRKYGGYTAYIEGWGLYSEYLPKELGFYSDPYSDFGRLAMELWRSCRLVVDTGIHAKKWTREESIDYYLNNTPNDELDCIKMVERHVVYPSQATAYKIGMNKIIDLKQKAKKVLGERFDIRYFHDAILVNGAVPLNILEKQIDEMIERFKKLKD